jgi:hypothetical protein
VDTAGRLAGMAYCSELIFRTTFPGETTLTTVRFDCEKLLKAMSPDEGVDIELAKLLAQAISFEQEEDAADADRVSARAPCLSDMRTIRPQGRTFRITQPHGLRASYLGTLKIEYLSDMTVFLHYNARQRY